MPGSPLLEVCEDLLASCLGDPDILSATVRDMVEHRWSSNDIGMHVTCMMPRGGVFPTSADRRDAVIRDITDRCREDQEFLRVTLSTDVAGWTDQELERYAQIHFSRPQRSSSSIS